MMHVDRDPTDALMPDDALTALNFPRDCLEPSNVDRPHGEWQAFGITCRRLND